MACNDRGDEEALTEGASTDDDIRDLQRRQKDTAMPLNAEDGPGEFFLPNGITGECQLSQCLAELLALNLSLTVLLAQIRQLQDGTSCRSDPLPLARMAMRPFLHKSHACCRG